MLKNFVNFLDKLLFVSEYLGQVKLTIQPFPKNTVLVKLYEPRPENLSSHLSGEKKGNPRFCLVIATLMMPI